MTIPKNTKRAKQAIANARNIRCYSLSNSFSGQPLSDKPAIWADDPQQPGQRRLTEVSQAEFLRYELDSMGTKLTAGTNGRYCIHVHSNLWYDFEATI